jgi:hypothetical protein
MARPQSNPGKRKRVEAYLYEDGSVQIIGPSGRTGVGNVGEGGTARGGYGTVRQFGPTSGKAGIKRAPGKQTRSRARTSGDGRLERPAPRDRKKPGKKIKRGRAGSTKGKDY